MIEAETKVIELRTGGKEWRLVLVAAHTLEPQVNVTAADLLATGYVPASRLLAVEAELGRVKAGIEPLRNLDRVCRLPGGPGRHGATGSITMALREIDERRYSPPSPPVAQEVGAAERVSHVEARNHVDRLHRAIGDGGDPEGISGCVRELLRYLVQQEQSEREAASLTSAAGHCRAGTFGPVGGKP